MVREKVLQQKMPRNKRKLSVLMFARELKRGIDSMDISFNFDIPRYLARQLLYHYRKQGLFNRPVRGIYKLSNRGLERLAYLKAREEISKVTGVDIGLSNCRDKDLPMQEILSRYLEITGKVPPLLLLNSN